MRSECRLLQVPPASAPDSYRRRVLRHHSRVVHEQCGIDQSSVSYWSFHRACQPRANMCGASQQTTCTCINISLPAGIALVAVLLGPACGRGAEMYTNFPPDVEQVNPDSSGVSFFRSEPWPITLTLFST